MQVHDTVEPSRAAANESERCILTCQICVAIAIYGRCVVGRGGVQIDRFDFLARDVSPIPLSALVFRVLCDYLALASGFSSSNREHPSLLCTRLYQ